MTRYKQTDFADEETSSIGSIHLNEVRTSPNMHIRFANRVNQIFMHLPLNKSNFPFSLPEYVSVVMGSSQQAREMSLDNHFSIVSHVYYASHRFAERS
jgi:hypothetical protein